MTWMRLPEEYRTDKSRFVIVPVSYEKALTYGKGASKGCVEIINASEHLEYYDEQYKCEAFEDGIKCEDVLVLSEKTPEEMVALVKEKVVSAISAHVNESVPNPTPLSSKATPGQVMSVTTDTIQENLECAFEVSSNCDDKPGADEFGTDSKETFIVGLGGDHAVTNGFVAGLEEKYGNDFSIIQFDAHSDFRDSWNGSALNHACVTKQIAKKHDVLLIGIRSQDYEEAQEIAQRDDVHIVHGWEFSVDAVKKILPKLKKNVFITIDVDGFDPSFIRNTGTPEPGGLLWNDVVGCLEEIFRCKDVIGADIVEFAPQINFESEAYALAKLAYKIMNLKKKFNSN